MEYNRFVRITGISPDFLLIIFCAIIFTFSWASTAKSENITLCYHRFNYSLDNPYSIPPELFEWQMSYIKENKIKILSLKQLNSEIKKSTPFKNNSVLVTVDDGWKDFDLVFPFVKQEKIPVTLFLYPDVIRYRDFFSIDDLKKLKKNKNITFGSHSYTHKLLINLDSETYKKEIIDSKYTLKNILLRIKRRLYLLYPVHPLAQAG